MEKKIFTNVTTKGKDVDVGKSPHEVVRFPVKVKGRASAVRKPKELVIPNGVKTVSVDLKRGVKLILIEDDAEDYSSIKTLEDVINLDKTKPHLIAGFIPSLYEEFMDGNRTIKPHVKVSDFVKVKRKFIDTKGDIPRQVTSLYFKSLNDMTVVIATLADNDYYLSNRLEVCK